MDQQQILQRIENSWAPFRELIAQVPAERALDVIPPGTWNLRDIAAHTAWWERNAIGHILGEVEVAEGKTVDQRNAVEYERISQLTYQQALDALDASHKALIDLVRSRTDIRPEQLKDDSWEHYEDHGADIKAWIETWQ